MQKNYVEPKCEMIEWSKNDVILTSTSAPRTTRNEIVLPDDD